MFHINTVGFHEAKRVLNIFIIKKTTNVKHFSERLHRTTTSQCLIRPALRRTRPHTTLMPSLAAGQASHSASESR